MDTAQPIKGEIPQADNVVGSNSSDLCSGLDWQRMFPVGPKRLILLRILREALEDVELVSQDITSQD